MKKIKKGFWESTFLYPSFNLRFFCTLIFVLAFFCIIGYYIFFKYNLFIQISDKIAVVSLFILSATLVLGIFAAYYALRQLVETRFNGLDEVARRELSSQHYARAISKWKEAFFIKPEPTVFLSLCESLILVGDYPMFDFYMILPNRKNLFKQDFLEEDYEQIILMYLKSIRHLLVKNQGEAEKNISKLIEQIKISGLPNLNWDFIDLQKSTQYQNLGDGECKNITYNLILYLTKTMSPNRKSDFENKKFSSQVAN